MKTQTVPNPKTVRPNTPSKPAANEEPPVLASYRVNFNMRQYADLQTACAQLDIVPEELIVRAVEKFLREIEAAAELRRHLPDELRDGPSFLELESASAMATAFMDLVVCRQSGDEPSEYREEALQIGVANLHAIVEEKLMAATSAAIKEIQNFKKLARGPLANGKS